MGRDDAKPIPGLHGGTAPARAFAAFMKPATANRPIEQFETQVTLPDFQLEPDQEFGQPDNGLFVDENGDPIPQSGEAPPDQLVDPAMEVGHRGKAVATALPRLRDVVGQLSHQPRASGAAAG